MHHKGTTNIKESSVFSGLVNIVWSQCLEFVSTELPSLKDSEKMTFKSSRSDVQTKIGTGSYGKLPLQIWWPSVVNHSLDLLHYKTPTVFDYLMMMLMLVELEKIAVDGFSNYRCHYD